MRTLLGFLANFLSLSFCCRTLSRITSFKINIFSIQRYNQNYYYRSFTQLKHFGNFFYCSCIQSWTHPYLQEIHSIKHTITMTTNWRELYKMYLLVHYVETFGVQNIFFLHKIPTPLLYWALEACWIWLEPKRKS